MSFLQLYFSQFLVFVLVLTRISGVIMTAPIFGSRSVPIQIRAFLAIGLSLIVTPLQDSSLMAEPASLLNLLWMLGREAMLGLALGLAVMILFTGLQLTGQIMGQMSGMSLADVFDPSSGTSVPVFAQLLDVVTLSVFVAIGGHRQVLDALLDTFRARPPGGDDFPINVVPTLTMVLGESFLIGFRAAAPVMVALLMSVLILGLISRTLPQLNVIAVGFSVNSLIMLAVFSVSLGVIVEVLHVRVESMIEVIHNALVLH